MTATGRMLFRVPEHHRGAVLRLSLGFVGGRVLSIGSDDFLRMHNRTGKASSLSNAEQSRFSHDLAFSGDEKLIIHANIFGVMKIWTVDSKELVFQSNYLSGLTMSPAAAAMSVRSCGPKSSMLWPSSLKRDPGDADFGGSGMYCLKMKMRNFLHISLQHQIPIHQAPTDGNLPVLKIGKRKLLLVSLLHQTRIRRSQAGGNFTVFEEYLQLSSVNLQSYAETALVAYPHSTYRRPRLAHRKSSHLLPTVRSAVFLSVPPPRLS